MIFLRFVLLSIITLFLTACGGGVETNSNLKTGVLLDSAVDGLVFKTESSSGITQNNGEFNFLEGETIQFYLGESFLGETTASNVLTFLDLVHEDKHKDTLINILQLLQSLDGDDNPENGIYISPEIHKLSNTISIDFSVSQKEFTIHQSVLELLARSGKTSGLVEPGRAALHFQMTLSREDIQKNVTHELYSVGGLIGGLKGKLRLTNYGLDELSIVDLEHFKFDTKLPDNSLYKIEILEQPQNQSCRLINSKGMIKSSDVSSISIICEETAQNMHGTVSGLNGSLILAVSSSRYFISSNGNFSIASDHLVGELSIEKQPANQQCIINETKNSFNIACSDEAVLLGGSISGLLGGLTLKNSDGSLLYLSKNGAFNFLENYSLNQEYHVEIVKQPVGQICSLNNESGITSLEEVSSIQIICENDLYNITIDVQGLGNVRLQIFVNDSELFVNSLGNYTQEIPYKSHYVVKFEAPLTKSCEISNGLIEANMPANDVEIVMTCDDVNFQYQFETNNYLGAFELLNSNGQSIVIDSNIVNINTKFGELFNFNIKQHPEGQTCTVDTLSDIVQSPITPIILNCVDNPEIINQLPIANGGIDFSIEENNHISLDGSHSIDPDGQISTYRWSQIAGPIVSLSDTTIVNPSFNVANVSVDTMFTFALVVTDNLGAESVQATVNVMILNVNTSPTAHAGVDSSVNENVTVNLDGNSSTDPDGTIEQYSWTQVAGPSVLLNKITTATPSFTSPSVSSETTLTFSLIVTDNEGAQSILDSVNVRIQNVNQIPVANAGVDINTNENSVVGLNGIESSDPDGSIESYVWTQISGETVALNGSDTVAPSFIASSVSTDTTLTFALVVVDNEGASSTSDTVSVLIQNVNQLPLANAGVDFNTNENTPVALNGNGSSDPDGSINSYIWTQISGETVALAAATTVAPSFIAPSVSTNTTLTFALLVMDNEGASSTSDTVSVTIKNVNQLPIANAGVDINSNENSVVVLNGNESDDPDGAIESYVWTQTSGESVALNGSDTAAPSFTAPSVNSEATLTFALVVTDNEGVSSTSDTVIVTIQNVNQLPVVTIVSNANVYENMPVSLDGSMSSDPDGSIETYSWENMTGPEVVLTGSAAELLSFTSPDVTSDTSMRFRLTVTDNDGASSYNDVTLTVKNINQIPVANAGIDQRIKTEAIVTLDGSASVDSDGEIQEYTWIQLSGTSVSLSDFSSVMPSFNAPTITIDEILEFQLTVTDNENAIGTATTSVLVMPNQSYYILNPRIQDQDLSIVSLSDNNTIAIGQTTLVLNKNQRGTIAAAELIQGSQISGTGNFDVASDVDGTDMLVPAQFLGSTFVVPHYRSSHTYFLLSPNVDATVSININGALTSLTLNAGVVNEFDAGSDNTISGMISVDQDILVSHTSNNKDVFAVPPVANELTGIRTNRVFVGALKDDTNITVTTSTGLTETHLLSSGERMEITAGTNGSEGQGNAYHIEADNPIAALQGADSDGSEATAFWSASNFATHYALPVNAQYIAVSCLAENVEITLTDLGNLQNPIQTQTCDSSTDLLGNVIPGKAYFGSSTDGVKINAGAVLNSTGEIYVIYEAASSNDEHNLLGNVQ